MNKSIVSTALKGIAVAMGVAVIVLNTLGTLTTDTAITLLSIGLTALAIEIIAKVRRQAMKAKSVLGIFLQVLVVTIGFLISLMIPAMLMPMPTVMMDAAPASGFISSPLDFLLNGLVNAMLLVWAGRRSTYKGLALWGQLLVLSFGTQVFMTQIETGYFLSAFPLLHDNFEIYRLILRGLITSTLVTLLVTWMVGGFSKQVRPQAQFAVTNDDAVKAGSWLAFIYVVLYVVFGYYVAWQSLELRMFYSGSPKQVSFLAQWGHTFMDSPEIPAFQYFRGFLWILCLIPLFKGFSAKRTELIIFSALALALLPTMQLAFANPLMPAGVSLAHFWEISVSMGIFGALCAWFVPKAVKS